MEIVAHPAARPPGARHRRARAPRAPGRDPLSLLQTIGVGLAGSFVGGLIVYAIAGEDAAGWSFVAALRRLRRDHLLIRRSRGRRAGGTGAGGPFTAR